MYGQLSTIANFNKIDLSEWGLIDNLDANIFNKEKFAEYLSGAIEETFAELGAHAYLACFACFSEDGFGNPIPDDPGTIYLVLPFGAGAFGEFVLQTSLTSMVQEVVDLKKNLMAEDDVIHAQTKGLIAYLKTLIDMLEQNS